MRQPWYLVVGYLLASLSANSATLEEAVSVAPSIDADNPFSKSLDGGQQQVITPGFILDELKRLNSLGSEESTSETEDKISQKEFLEIKEIVEALKAPAPPVEYVETDTLPLRSKAINEYELRGIIISYEEDPSVHRVADMRGSMVSQETVHVVRSFETVDGLSQLYEVPASGILAANGLNEGARLYPGMALLIPARPVSEDRLPLTNYSLELGEFGGQSAAANFIASARGLYGDILEGDRFSAKPLNNGRVRVRVGSYSDMRLAENKCALIEILDGGCEVVADDVYDDTAGRAAQKRYSAILGIPGQSEEYFVSEGDFLGQTAAVVVSISERQLILQDKGRRAVLSLDQEVALRKAKSSSVGAAPAGPSVSCAVLRDKYSNAPDVARLCPAGSAAAISCASLDLATKVGVAECG